MVTQLIRTFIFTFFIPTAFTLLFISCGKSDFDSETVKVSFTSSSYVSASEASATGGIMIYSSNQGKRKAFAVRLNNSEDYTAGTIELPVGVWDIAAIGWQSSIFSGAPYCAKKSVNLRPTVNGGVRYVALDLYTSRCDERLKSDYKNFFGEKSGSPALQLSLCNGLSTSGNVGCAAYASQRPTSIRVSLLSFTVSAKSNANGLDNLVVDNKKRPLSLCVATSGNTPIILSAEVSPGGSLVRIPIGTTPAQSPLRYMAIWGRIALYNTTECALTPYVVYDFNRGLANPAAMITTAGGNIVYTPPTPNKPNAFYDKNSDVYQIYLDAP